MASQGMSSKGQQYTFTKMHGLGNDFIIFDQRDGTPSLQGEKIAMVACRNKGVGCDQVIHIKSPTVEGADIRLEMYNADGQKVGACGNGTRCVASMVMKELDKEKLAIETDAGILHCRAASINKAEVTVDMGKPRTLWTDIPLLSEMDTLNVQVGEADLPPGVAVSMGNPHIIFFIDDVEEFNVEGVGPTIEFHKIFPKRTNVEFVKILDQHTARMRVWERGVGVTQACGTGACATAVAGVLRGLLQRKSEIILDGGSLFIEWREDDGHVLMTGPATYVFEGTVTI